MKLTAIAFDSLTNEEFLKLKSIFEHDITYSKSEYIGYALCLNNVHIIRKSDKLNLISFNDFLCANYKICKNAEDKEKFWFTSINPNMITKYEIDKFSCGRHYRHIFIKNEANVLFMIRKNGIKFLINVS